MANLSFVSVRFFYIVQFPASVFIMWIMFSCRACVLASVRDVVSAISVVCIGGFYTKLLSVVHLGTKMN